jgi:sulfur-carrier protein
MTAFSSLDGRPEAVAQVRVVLPHHLRNLAQVGAEVSVKVAPPVSIGAILDAVEAAHPVLKGTIRDHVTQKRRPFLRFFACGEDVTLDAPDKPLPDAIATQQEPFLVVGAIAGG